MPTRKEIEKSILGSAADLVTRISSVERAMELLGEIPELKGNAWTRRLQGVLGEIQNELGCDQQIAQVLMGYLMVGDDGDGRKETPRPKVPNIHSLV